jgi:hypothetical protein
VQVDPIKPKLKAPGTKHLKLQCDEELSSSAFNVNLHRYNKALKDALNMRGYKNERYAGPSP